MGVGTELGNFVLKFFLIRPIEDYLLRKYHLNCSIIQCKEGRICWYWYYIICKYIPVYKLYIQYM